MIEIINTENNLREEVSDWVRTLNAIPTSMIERLMNENPNEWKEITSIFKIGTVVVPASMYTSFPNVDVDGYEYETSTDTGYVADIIKSESGEISYIITLDDINGDEVNVRVNQDQIEKDDLNDDDTLPIWGTMFQFDDNIDDVLLKDGSMVNLLSEIGFRVYRHNAWGVYFGIDAAGFDFYNDYWIPLYNARRELIDKKINS